jgi:hypothetical protein
MGCNKEQSHTSILGSWNCEEFSDGGQRIYQVNIVRNNNLPDATNEYIIYNFHNLGNTEYTEVYIRESIKGELTITGTAASDISFVGQGLISPDFSSIKWSYQFNNGSKNSMVTASYY